MDTFTSTHGDKAQIMFGDYIRDLLEHGSNQHSFTVAKQSYKLSYTQEQDKDSKQWFNFELHHFNPQAGVEYSLHKVTSAAKNSLWTRDEIDKIVKMFTRSFQADLVDRLLKVS